MTLRNDQRTVGDMTPGEFTNAISTAFVQAMHEAGHGTPDRSRLAYLPEEGSPVTRPAGSAGRTMPGAERAWNDQVAAARLDPEERELRSFESDMAALKWFDALGHGDHQRMREAIDEDPFNDPNTRADVALGAGAGTGYGLVPQGFSNQLQLHLERASKLRTLVNVVPVTGYSTRVPKESVHISAKVVAEGASLASTTDPIFTSAELKMLKIGAYTILTNELLADNVFNTLNVIGRQAGEAAGRLIDNEICVGSNFSSVLHDITADASIDHADAVATLASVTDKFYALGEQFAAHATWLGNDVWAKALANAVDGDGRPLWLGSGNAPAAAGDSAQGSGIPNVMQRPLYRLPIADVPADTCFFGDLSGYTLGIRGGFVAESSREELFSTDRTSFRFYQRMDGTLTQSERIAHFDVA